MRYTLSAAAFKPSYKTACRIAFGINTILASAFLLSFPLLRITDAKCPVTPLKVVSPITHSSCERSCLIANYNMHRHMKDGSRYPLVVSLKSFRYAEYLGSAQSFQNAHRNWRFK